MNKQKVYLLIDEYVNHENKESEFKVKVFSDKESAKAEFRDIVLENLDSNIFSEERSFKYALDKEMSIKDAWELDAKRPYLYCEDEYGSNCIKVEEAEVE